MAFFGLFLGNGVVRMLEKIVIASNYFTTLPSFIQVFVYLICCYLGVRLTFRASKELAISIPFIRFSTTTQKTRRMMLDQSVLEDPRIIELCKTGILDNCLSVPKFLLNEQYSSHSAIETFKQLELISGLHLHVYEASRCDTKSIDENVHQASMEHEAHLLTARTGIADTEVKSVCLEQLAKILKPLKQSGEAVVIKVQRPGKEMDQGVGYLDDGTMVVINGGRDFIGQTVETSLISVKHTSSGRILFCGIKDQEVESLQLMNEGLEEVHAYE